MYQTHPLRETEARSQQAVRRTSSRVESAHGLEATASLALGDGQFKSFYKATAELTFTSLSQSATYLLAHVSENATGRGAPSLPGSPLASEPPAIKEDGHADAVWCTKWAKLPGGDGVVVTGSADHTIKLWCVLPSRLGSQPFVANGCSSIGIRQVEQSRPRLCDHQQLSASSDWTLIPHRRELSFWCPTRSIPSSVASAWTV